MRKFLDVICFVLGPVMLILGFLLACQVIRKTPEYSVAYNTGRIFLPTEDSIALMVIGAGFICIGVLRRNWADLNKTSLHRRRLYQSKLRKRRF